MSSSRRHRSRPASTAAGLLAVVLAGLLLTGCAGGSTPTTSSQGPTGATSSGGGTGSAASTSSSSSGGGGGTADDGFSWAPPGPWDAGDPPPNRWYAPLVNHDCQGLVTALANEPGDALWQAMTALCKAAVQGDTGQWAVAQQKAQAFAAAGPADGSTGCLATAAKSLLVRALAWHARNPGEQPKVTFAKPGQRTACPFRITKVAVVDDGGNPTGQPLRGPLAGGTLLAIYGDGLTHDFTVTVGGHKATPVDVPVDGAVVVSTPSVSHPFVGKILLTNNGGGVIAAQRFTYVAGSPSASPSPT